VNIATTSSERVFEGARGRAAPPSDIAVFRGRQSDASAEGLLPAAHVDLELV
jgi:hypothetical protein